MLGPLQSAKREENHVYRILLISNRHFWATSETLHRDTSWFSVVSCTQCFIMFLKPSFLLAANTCEYPNILILGSDASDIQWHPVTSSDTLLKALTCLSSSRQRQQWNSLLQNQRDSGHSGHSGLPVRWANGFRMTSITSLLIDCDTDCDRIFIQAFGARCPHFYSWVFGAFGLW